MKLTPENKAYIDKLSYTSLLERWRHAPCGDPWFQDETGDYLGKRMAELRAQPDGQERHVASSKLIGWD